jgi:tRNA(Ile)-lysidine synthase
MLCVSGGSDSAALAAIAKQWIAQNPERAPQSVVLGHAFHGLRGRDSELDRDAVWQLGAQLGFPVLVADAQLEGGANLEERAREVRYQRLHALAPQAILITAHHQDDAIETLLLRLLRGAGAWGLSGVQPWRDDGVWRPLLEIPRTTLEALVHDQHLPWRLDQSNLDTRHTRNWIRHCWLPEQERQEPGTRESLCALTQATRSLRSTLDTRLQQLQSVWQVTISNTGFGLHFGSHPLVDPDDPELEMLLNQLWARMGRRPWATQQRHRLLADVLSGHKGTRFGGQQEIARWAKFRLEITLRARE